MRCEALFLLYLMSFLLFGICEYIYGEQVCLQTLFMFFWKIMFSEKAIFFYYF